MTEVAQNSRKESNPQPGSNPLSDWFTSRIQACDLFDALIPADRKRAHLPRTASPVDLLGKALWVTFTLIVISGIGLLAGYSPGAGSAFSSVEYIQTSFPLGWWFRGVHKYATDLFIILAALRLIRLSYRRTYKSLGEFTWLCAIGILIAGAIAGFTGYLLVWHERAFLVGHVLNSGSMDYEVVYPLGGLGLSGWSAQMALGGDEITQTALSGAFTWHIALGFLIAFVALFWRFTARPLVPKSRHVSLHVPPGLVWGIVVILTLLALMLPPPVGTPADGILKPHPLLADWFQLWFYQLTDILRPAVAAWLIIFGFLVTVLLPWIDRTRTAGPRPAVTALIVATLLTWAIFTLKALGWTLSDSRALGLAAIIWFVALLLGAVIEWRPILTAGKTTDPEVGAE